MQSQSHFAHNLPLLRRRAGYTQETLAEALNVSRQAVSKWESGATLPEAATLLTLSECLSCTLDELMKIPLPEDFGRRAPVADPPEVVPDPMPEGWGDLLGAYDLHMNRFATFIGAGVLLILLGLGQLMLLSALLSAAVATLVFLLCLAASILLFVYSGITHSAFLKGFPAPPQDLRPAADPAFLRVFPAGVATSVAVIVADLAGLVLLLTVLRPYYHRFLTLGVGVFFIVLGVAVGTLVYLGILHSHYTAPAWEAEAPPARRKEDPLCGLIMGAAAVFYLLAGFCAGVWHPTWVIFLFASAVCGFLNARARRKK